jgi:hypothetical protein
MQERSIPIAAKEDANSVEMLRVWIAQKSLHCSMKVGMYSETTKIPEAHAWGMILADVTLHLSKALCEMYGTPVKETEQAVLASFSREIETRTTVSSGGFSSEPGSRGPGRPS